MIYAIRQWVSQRLPWSLKNVLIDIRDPIVAFAYQRRRQIPPPHAIKTRAVISLAQRHNVYVLVETGTYRGEMARKCSKHFKEIWTIELSKRLAEEAARRLAKLSNVRVTCGESSGLLPQILAGIREPVVFWLDAHYSGGITARGATECPLERELHIIAEHPCHDHIILIDDVRLMGSGDYPSLEKVRELVRGINPRYRIEVHDDMLRCEPPEITDGRANHRARTD